MTFLLLLLSTGYRRSHRVTDVAALNGESKIPGKKLKNRGTVVDTVGRRARAVTLSRREGGCRAD